eukprot:m.72068 g.72068  ORF g.72068 m.72068 type:complete len:1162 (+) comp24424_c0_seq2:168-3653(+)
MVSTLSVLSVFGVVLFVAHAIAQTPRPTKNGSDPVDHRECIPKVPLCRELSTETDCIDSENCEWLSDVYADAGLTSVTYSGICVRYGDRDTSQNARINCDDEPLFQNKTACDETKNCQWDDTVEELAFCSVYTCEDILDEETCQHFSIAELSDVACEWVDGFCMVQVILEPDGGDDIDPDRWHEEAIKSVCGTFLEESECNDVDEIENCEWNKDVCSYGACDGLEESPCKRIRGCLWRDDTNQCDDLRESVFDTKKGFRPDASRCTSFSADKDACLDNYKALGCMWEESENREKHIARCRGPCRTQFAEVQDGDVNCVTYATFYNTSGTLVVDQDPGCRSPLRKGLDDTITFDLHDALSDLTADFGDDRDIMCFNAFDAEAAECDQIQSEDDCGRSSTNCKWDNPPFYCNFLPCGRGSPCSPSSDCTHKEAWDDETQGPICCNMLDVYCKNYGEEDPACYKTNLNPFAIRHNCSQNNDPLLDQNRNFCSVRTTEEECTDVDIEEVCTWQDSQCKDAKSLDAEFDSSLGASPCFDPFVMYDSTACNKLAPRCSWLAISYDDVEESSDGYCAEADCWTQETKADCLSFGDKDEESSGCTWKGGGDDVMGFCQEPEPDDTYTIDIGDDGLKQLDFNMTFLYDECFLHGNKDECDAQAACYFVTITTDDEPETDTPGETDAVFPEDVTGYCDIAMCGVMETEQACVSFNDDCVWLDMGEEITHVDDADTEDTIEHYAYCVDKTDQNIDGNGNPFDNPSIGESFYLSKCFGEALDSNETACTEEPKCVFIVDNDYDFTMCTEAQCYHFVNESSCQGAQATYNISCSFNKQMGDADGFCYEKDIDTFEIDNSDLALLMRTQCEQLDDEAECEDYGFCHYLHGVVPACRTLDLYCNLAEPIPCSNYRNATLCDNDLRCDYHAVENTCTDLDLPTKDDLCDLHVTFCSSKDIMDNKIDADDLSCGALYDDVESDFRIYEYFDAISSRQLRQKKKMLIKQCCLPAKTCENLKIETEAPSVPATVPPTVAPSMVPHESPSPAPTTREPTDAGETFTPTTANPTTQPPTPSTTKKQPLPTNAATATVGSSDTTDNNDADLNGTSTSTSSSPSNTGTIAAVVVVMLLVVIIGGAVWWRTRQRSSAAQFKTLYENPNWMGNDMGRKADLLNDMY